jgi:hypothetical protein
MRASNVDYLSSLSVEVYAYRYETVTLYSVITVFRYLTIVTVYQGGYHVLLQLVLCI